MQKENMMETICDYDLLVTTGDNGICLYNLKIQPTLKEKVIEIEQDDRLSTLVRNKIAARGELEKWKLHNDGGLRYLGGIYIPKIPELRNEIPYKAHYFAYIIHTFNTKMYHDLCRQYWWRAEWKLDHLTMDFVAGLPRSSKGRDSVWVIVDRLTKSTHFLVVKITDTTETLGNLSWEDHLPLAEFTYNNSYQASIWMAPHEVIPSVKVLWRRGNTEEMIWELESEMRTKYLELFNNLGGEGRRWKLGEEEKEA
ncbi:hypothetical protein L3X38_033786 [Prunus dulcis]|uniref:Uncharacterized protein n=1 Tax=Prunus dulcis TaxID=3755 RepID=A0AAD4YXY4_PRUDU|nr:hypothetical protein L3X38_033786 [Prunus dulcis]